MSYPLNTIKFFSQKNLKAILHNLKIPMYGIYKGLTLSPESAEALVEALKSWAKEYGAAYFTYWSFLSSEWEFKTPYLDIGSMEGNCLIHKSVEIKSLNEKRVEKGYVTWDSSFPPFLMQNEDLETILCLPVLLYSIDHQTLDQRTPFLRSSKILETEIARLLNFCKIEMQETDCCVEIRWDVPISDALNISDSTQKSKVQSYLHFLQEGASFYQMNKDPTASLYQLKIPKEKGVFAFHHMQLLLEKMNSYEKGKDSPFLFWEQLFQNGLDIQLEWQFVFEDKKKSLQSSQNGMFLLIFATAISYALYEYKELYQCLMTSMGLRSLKNKTYLCLSEDFGKFLNLFIQNLIEGKDAVNSLDKDLTLLMQNILNVPSFEKNKQELCTFNGQGFVFQGFSSSSDLAFAMTTIQATIADSLHLILDEISDAVRENNSTHLSPILDVLKNRLLETKSEFKEGESIKFKFHPDIFSHLLDPKAIRVFGNILSENELRVLQKKRYESYARKMKQRIEKTLDLCKLQVPFNANLSKENKTFLLYFAALQKILEQSSDLGEEVQSKLFFELGEPAIAAIWQLLQKN